MWWGWVVNLPILSQAMKAIKAPPTLPICTIAVMFPTFAAAWALL
jgi:hypothetical protein